MLRIFCVKRTCTGCVKVKLRGTSKLCFICMVYSPGYILIDLKSLTYALLTYVLNFILMLQLYYPFGGQIQTRATRETHQLTTKLERQNFIVILEMELVVTYNKMEGCWFYRRTYITQPFNFSKFPWKYAIFATSFPLCRSKFGFCTKICWKISFINDINVNIAKNFMTCRFFNEF